MELLEVFPMCDNAHFVTLLIRLPASLEYTTEFLWYHIVYSLYICSISRCAVQGFRYALALLTIKGYVEYAKVRARTSGLVNPSQGNEAQGGYQFWRPLIGSLPISLNPGGKISVSLQSALLPMSLGHSQEKVLIDSSIWHNRIPPTGLRIAFLTDREGWLARQQP